MNIAKTITTNLNIGVNANAISDYCETALNVVEKLADEYFFPVPENFDEDVMDMHLDKVLNNYAYIAFAVGIIKDALKHIDESNMNVVELVEKGVS